MLVDLSSFFCLSLSLWITRPTCSENSTEWKKQAQKNIKKTLCIGILNDDDEPLSRLLGRIKVHAKWNKFFALCSSPYTNYLCLKNQMRELYIYIIICFKATKKSFLSLGHGQTIMLTHYCFINSGFRRWWRWRRKKIKYSISSVDRWQGWRQSITFPFEMYWLASCIFIIYTPPCAPVYS